VRVAAVIVNYRTPEMTARATTALLAELATVSPSRLYLVDNDSQDGSFAKLHQSAQSEGWGERVVLLESKRNGGYGYGINRAVQEALRGDDQPDYVYILNSDAFVNEGSLKRLVDFIESRPGVGIAGSPILDPTGVQQMSAFRYPSALGELAVESESGIVARLFPDREVALPHVGETSETDWISGASMLVRRAVFEEIGGFDEGFFLYFEEVDFCRRARRAGWKSWTVADAPITHIGSVSTGMEDRARPVPAYWFDSRERYFLKHHGRLYAALADVSFLAGVALRRAKYAVLRRRGNERPGLVGGFLRGSARNLTMPAPPAPEDCVIESRPTGMLEGASAWARPRDRRAAAEMGLFELLAEDFVTHDKHAMEPGLWAIGLHRIGTRAQALRSPALRATVDAVYRTLSTGVDWIWGIQLPRSVEVGRRVRLWHYGSMLLNACAIGDDVQLRHCTTLGPKSGESTKPSDLPVIEARADIGAGACILGPVVVGHDAQVGANTLVMSDVAPNTAVLGVPARVMPPAPRGTDTATDRAQSTI
jgi:GT2 family glycosyltransferase/serine acetyltransferase